MSLTDQDSAGVMRVTAPLIHHLTTQLQHMTAGKNLDLSGEVLEALRHFSALNVSHSKPEEGYNSSFSISSMKSGF